MDRFSIEEKCKALQVLPFEQRDHRVYILMKQLAYVHFDNAWHADFYSRAADELGIRFVGGYGNDADFKPGGQDPPAAGWKEIEEPGKIDNLHPLSRENFLKEVGKSKLMLGIGLPTWSPSPYDALCLGVPFLNPVSAENVIGCLIDLISYRFVSLTRMTHGMNRSGRPSILSSLAWDQGPRE